MSDPKKRQLTKAADPFDPRLKKFLTPIADLKPDPQPLREHGEPSIESIVRSFERFGQRKPLIADATGIIYAGNGRLEAAKRLGWKEILVVRFSGPANRIRAFAMADNRTAELSTWHWDRLLDQLKELRSPEYPATFFSWDEAIFADLPSTPTATPTKGEKAEEKIEEAIRQMLVKLKSKDYVKLVKLMEDLCEKLKIENYYMLVLKAARAWKKATR